MAAGMIQGLEEGAATPAASLEAGEDETPLPASHSLPPFHG